MNQVEEEESLIRALEEEAIEVECLLVEPHTDQVSVDGVLYFHEENLKKCTEIEDIPCGFGGPDSSANAEGEDTSELNVLDAVPLKVEVGNLLAADGVSTCEDYLLDIGFAESVDDLDYGSSEGLHFGNSGSETQIPGFNSGDNGNYVMSNLLTEIIPVSECQKDLLGKTTCDFLGSVNCNRESETSVEAKCSKCSTSSESQNVDKLKNVPNLLVRPSSHKKENDTIFPPDFTSDGMCFSSRSMECNEVKPVSQGVEVESLRGWVVLTKSSAQNSSVGALLTQKRLRKPTRRYIDESSDLSSRYCRKRQETSSTSKDKSLGVRRLRHRHHMRSKANMLSSEDSFGKAIQVPFGTQGPTKCRKKHTSIVKINPKEEDKTAVIIGTGLRRACKNLPIGSGGGPISPATMPNSDEEPSPAGSEDDSETTVRSAGGGLRKLHRLWTLPEVRKLIDGVSHYGVGRWTHIKRLLFSSSVHRTPVDLKDKWRNLLKASCALKKSRREDEQKRNQPWRPLPKSMLCRVRELATVYPYPREGKSKISKSNFSHVRCVSSPNLPARSQGNQVPFR